jgi:hypothetical protein
MRSGVTIMPEVVTGAHCRDAIRCCFNSAVQWILSCGTADGVFVVVAFKGRDKQQKDGAQRKTGDWLES